MQIDASLITALKQRNQEFAQQPERQSPSELVPLLHFLIDQERYAIDQTFVREVVPLRRWSRVPTAPDWIRGITAVRGRVVAVVDLRRLFGLEQHNLSDKNFLLILHDQHHEIGILVDRIHGFQTRRKNEIRHAESIANGVPTQFIQGFLPSADATNDDTKQRHVVLDGGALLRDLTGRELS